VFHKRFQAHNYLADKLSGVQCFTILPYLKVKMSPRTSSCTSDFAYPLSLPDTLPFGNKDARQMTIPCAKAVSMLYNDQLSISTHPSCVGDNTIH
jgi:hypothetical protein